MKIKNYTGIIFSVILIIIYFVLLYSFLDFYRNEDIRTNVNQATPGVVSRVITNATGSVDEHCGRFILDRTEAGPKGIQEIGHIDKDQSCYLKYKYLLVPSYIVGILPTVLANLVNCPNWNNCPKEMGSAGYTIWTVIFLGQLLFIAILGYIIGEVISRIFKRYKILKN